MSEKDLEGPGTREAPDWASLYRARGEEVSESRPVFTGDVFKDVPALGATKSLITALVLQHPCALRLDGVNLVPRLLVAEVRESALIPFGGWKRSYKIMPLPELDDDRAHFAARLNGPHLVDPDTLHPENRIASMSQVGVNLLLQRWVHHNSRVVIPTSNYQDVTAEQFEEADLIEEWCDELAVNPSAVKVQTAAAHEWMRSESSSPGKRWQDLLQEPQTRASVRTAMRRHLKELRSPE